MRHDGGMATDHTSTTTADSVLAGSVLAVCSGRTTVLTHGSRSTRTGFLKQPHAGRVDISSLGISTDEHVYEHHGGPDMALLVYSVNHYAHWRSLGLELPEVAAFGENLTVTGLAETDVHLGDTFRVGTCTVQVCQPRTPCSKLAIRFGRRDMAVLMQNTGYTGYLLRILETGTIGAGDTMTLIDREPHGITVASAGHTISVDRNDLDAARRLLELQSLGSAVRRTLTSRVAEQSAPNAQPLGLDERRLFGAD
jgi:MOSC domain-containing protein YiiM